MQIIDNKKQYEDDIKTVKDWIERKTKNAGKGDLDVVTGYVTVEALKWLSDIKEINKFKLLIGDFVQKNAKKFKTPVVDLLSEKNPSESLFKLSEDARKAVEFLKSENVEVKTIDSSRCHAKAYIFNCPSNRDLDYCVIGSSNLTASGIGEYDAGNIELNLANTGNNLKEIKNWFEDIFNNNPEVQDYKETLIKEISTIYQKYRPYDIYLKMLYTLNKDSLDTQLNAKIEKSLEKTALWKKLYSFQKVGVLDIIAKLKKFNGAILADAVGLGKTFQALAVIYYYYSRGYDVTVFCPKKLELGWRKFLADEHNQFYQLFANNARYKIRFHTDLSKERMSGKKYQDNPLLTFQDARPKLFIIDESHNFRNKNIRENTDRMSRYQFFLEELMKKNDDVKLLMLSATPLNNSYMDIANQLLLITKGDPKAFHSELKTTDTITQAFKAAQKELEEGVNNHLSVEELFKKIDSNALDAKNIRKNLILARTRNAVAGNNNQSEQSALVFPRHGILRDEDNDNIEDKIQDNKTLKRITGYEDVEKFIDSMPLMRAYQPGVCLKEHQNTKGENKADRDERLVKMLRFMLFKRYESSWYSFYKTLEKFHEKHIDVLAMLENAENAPNAIISGKIETGDEDEDEEINENVESSAITVADIKQAGKLKEYTEAVKTDLDGINKLLDKLSDFNQKVENEMERKQSENISDDKLEQLINFLKKKPEYSKNMPEFGKKKVLIFTTYKDTATYLYKNLLSRDFKNIAMVTGGCNYVCDKREKHLKEHDEILKRFSPFSQMFLEMKWEGFYKDPEKSDIDNYLEWKNNWLPAQNSKDAKFASSIIDNPVDILIATDCLSEGQNFQDCDTVLHYDIHWNPVRLVQRFGRIDRIGSPNAEVYSVYCWVTDSIDKYLDLETKINQKSIAGAATGQENAPPPNSELHKINQYFNEKMLRELETEQHKPENKKLELAQPSSDSMLTDAIATLKERIEEIRALPNGICSQFSIPENSNYPAPGIIALLEESSDSKEDYIAYKLLYITEDGKMHMGNQDDIHGLLNQYCTIESPPAFPDIDLKKYSRSICNVIQEMNMLPPTSTPELAKAQKQLKESLKYKLIAWLYVNYD